MVVREQGLDALNTAVAKLAADCTDPKVALNVQYTYAAGVVSVSWRNCRRHDMTQAVSVISNCHNIL